MKKLYLLLYVFMLCLLSNFVFAIEYKNESYPLLPLSSSNACTDNVWGVTFNTSISGITVLGIQAQSDSGAVGDCVIGTLNDPFIGRGTLLANKTCFFNVSIPITVGTKYGMGFFCNGADMKYKSSPVFPQDSGDWNWLGGATGFPNSFSTFTDVHNRGTAGIYYTIGEATSLSVELKTPVTNSLLYPLTNFSYNVTSTVENINNCSLLFNNVTISTDLSPANNSINYFYNIDTSEYTYINWGINCYGDTTNTNSSTNIYQRASLNITAYSQLTGVAINSFSIYVDDVLNGSTSVGNYSLTNLTGGYSYNITIDALGYELKSYLFTSTSIDNKYNFTLYDTNSLNITIYDESTGIKLSQNVTIKFTSNSSEFTNISEGGSAYFSNLTAQGYQVIFFSEGYTNRTYTITIGDRSHQFLEVYMVTGSESTLFTISDSNTDTVLPEVLFTQSKLIGSEWVTVESKYTDITGKVKITYTPDTNYRFYLSKDNYNDLIFNLNPILFDTYSIKMDISTLLNYSFNLDNIAIVYGPQTFNNSQVTNFTFLINSPYGSLTDYGINLTYPGGSNYVIGSNAVGGTLTALINITGADVFDTVRLEYFYITTISGRRNFTDIFPITFPDGTDTLTFMANKNKTFGLGIFERVLTATLIAIFIVGIASLVGQPLPGFALNLFIQSYLTYIGFIPIWITLPSLLLGIMIIIWKSGGT